MLNKIRILASGNLTDSATDVTDSNVITTTLNFNDEWVTGFETVYYPFPEVDDPQFAYDIQAINPGEDYRVFLPRYGGVVVRFTTKKKI